MVQRHVSKTWGNWEEGGKCPIDLTDIQNFHFHLSENPLKI